MTFDTMEPVYRDDEASDRFVGPWFRGVARTGRDRHFVQRSGRTGAQLSGLGTPQSVRQSQQVSYENQ
jgi:hypothetical protein